MKRTTITMAATLAGLLAVPSIASAAVTAITTEPVSLRAGPALDFPVVDQIPDDARVTVFGCVRAYQWCDIAWRDARGWVRGDDLSYLYQQRRVRLIEYGPRIGLPVVVFSFDSYWDRYYRARPFYTERTRWRTTWRDRDGVRGKARVNVERDRRDTTKTERRTDRIDRQKDRTKQKTDRRDDRTERGLKQNNRPGRTTRDARPDRNKPQAEVRERPARPAPGSAIQRGGERSGPAARDGGGGGPGRGGDGPKDRN